MRAARRPPSDIDHLPLLAELSALERASDGPLSELALRIWRCGSARAAQRFHRQAMLRLAREQVREAIRACRSRDAADDDAALRRQALEELRRYWQAYRQELRRSGE
jgi:hypothetical protein